MSAKIINIDDLKLINEALEQIPQILETLDTVELKLKGYRNYNDVIRVLDSVYDAQAMLSIHLEYCKNMRKHMVGDVRG